MIVILDNYARVGFSFSESVVHPAPHSTHYPGDENIIAVTLAGDNVINDVLVLKRIHLSERIALQLDECLQEGAIPSWMIKRKTLLCAKDTGKENVASNFRLIACFALTWKLVSGSMISTDTW